MISAAKQGNEYLPVFGYTVRTAVFHAAADSAFMPGAELLVNGGMTYLAK